MGCGSSKQIKTSTPQQQAAPDEHFSKAEPAKKVAVGTNGTSVDTTSENTSSRDTTPTQQKSRPGSQRNGSVRSLEGRKINDSRKSVEAKPELQGPLQDYTGTSLEKCENERLGHITALATTILKAPIALVVLGVEGRMVLASAVGIEPLDDSWLPAFCAWALNQPSGGMTVENAAEDPRTQSLSWVAEDPEINFYTGASVHTPKGERLGMLCVVDSDAKPGSTPLCMSLPNLADMIARELPVVEQEPKAEALLLRAMDTYWDGSVLVDTKEGRWKIKYANEAFSNMTGIDRHKARGRDLWDLVELAGSAATAKPWERHVSKTQKKAEFDILPVVASCSDRPSSRHTSGSREGAKRFKVTMRPNTVQIMENYGISPDEKEIEGWYFAVFTYLTSNSRGSYTNALGTEDGMVPFEGVELGPIIGKGSFGSVFRAVWGGKIVAIKVIEFGDIARVDSSGDPLEASLMLSMKHINIVETIQYTSQHRNPEEGYEVQPQTPGLIGQTGGASGTSQKPASLVLWLMLEYCDLGTLSDGVNSGMFHNELAAGATETVGVPSMLVILETGLDIALGLNFIHSHNILHGDLTAGNVLLASIKDERGKRNFKAKALMLVPYLVSVETFWPPKEIEQFHSDVNPSAKSDHHSQSYWNPNSSKIADFGLSRQTITSKVETNTYGTVTHMPPELLNEGILSKAADVYAFGVLLYEMFARQPVWAGLRHPQIIHAIAVQKKHPTLPDTAPQAYRDLAYACMAADPDARPDFKAIISELESMLEV